MDNRCVNEMREMGYEQGSYLIGSCYFIRTVTYHYTGLLVSVTSDELVLDKAAWIADSGRFADAMKTGEFSEVEPYPDGCLVRINRRAIVDCCDWKHGLPRTQK